MNTIIATSENGTKLVKFNGSNYSNPCYFIIENNTVVSTYCTKNAGFMTAGLALKTRVNKATSQKYDGKLYCEIETLQFSSPMEVLSFLTNTKYNGSLIENSKVVA